jgi:hypothetical protein
MTESSRQSSDQADSPVNVSYRLAVCSLPHDLDAAATLLSHVVGLNPIDAKTRLRHVPGVWPDKLTRRAAETAARGLQALEMSVVAVPAGDVPDLHPGQLVHHVQCTNEGFVVVPIKGEPNPPVDWTRLALLSVANVAGLKQEASGNVPDGVFRHAPGITSSRPATEDHGLEMWLLCESPFQAFRISAEAMNYEYLGDRRTPSSAENFANLVQDIRRHAPQLTLTDSAEAYLNKPLRALPRVNSPAAHRDAVTARWVGLHPDTDTEQQPQSSPDT